MSQTEFEKLWKKGEYGAARQEIMKIRQITIVKKLPSFWKIIVDHDPLATRAILHDVDSATILVILLNLYIPTTGIQKRQQKSSSVYYYDALYDLDSWFGILGPILLIRVWKIIETWPIVNDKVFRSICKHLLEDVFTMEDMIPENKTQKDEILQIYMTLYRFMKISIPLGDRISLVANFWDTHEESGVIRDCLLDDSELRSSIVDLMIEIDSTNLPSSVTELLTTEDRQQLFNFYRTMIIRSLNRKGQSRLRGVERYRPLAQWSLRLLRQHRPRQDTDVTQIIRERNIQTTQSVISALNRMRSGRIDPVVLRQLENMVNKNVLRDATLRNVLIRAIRLHRVER